MKTLLALCLLAACTLVRAGDMPAPGPARAGVVQGEVLEVKDVESYTYLRLKTRDGETWAAVEKAPVKRGDKVTIGNVMVMTNFESKALKQTFPKIVFGSLEAGGAAATAAMQSAHAGLGKPADVGDVHVPKAQGANARTVAEVMTHGADLKEKQVLVRGKIVKYNAGIMGKNWIHLRDGTGSAADGSNDVLVTTTGTAKPGDVITVKGTVRTNKDFGAGYSYKVLIEDATVQP